MIGRAALVSLLVAALFAACKKKESPAADPAPAGSSAGTTPTSGGSASGGRPARSTPTPAGDNRVTDTTDWAPRTGPGFTITAPRAGTLDKVAAHDDVRAFDRYTFHEDGHEKFVVEITTLPEDADLGMTLNNMRMRITSRTQSVRNEDLLDPSEATGDVTGRDISYVVDEGDDTLHARSKVLGKGLQIFEIRAVAMPGKDNAARVDRFVDSFAFTP